MSKERISLKMQSFIVISIVAVPLMLMLLVLNVYTVNRANIRVYESGINTASLYQNELESDLKSIENMMISLVASDPDYRQIQYVSDDYQKQENIYNLFSRYKDIMSTYSVIGVINLRVKENNINRSEYRGIYNYDFKKALDEDITELLNYETNPTQLGWIYREIMGRQLLFRVIGNGNIFTTCVIDPEKFMLPAKSSVNFDFSGDKGVLLYSTSQFVPTHAYDVLEKNNIELYDAQNKMYITGRAQKYLVSSVHSSYANTHFFYMQPYAGIFGHLDAIQATLILFSVLLCCVLPFIVLKLIKGSYNPMNMLIKTMQQIRTGHHNAKMSEEYRVEEYHVLSVTFNELMQEIQQLKIEGYEKEISEQKTQLMLLQSQIRPHFYLNSLKNFYALAQERRVDDIQMFALKLSEYLRYLFKEPSAMVSLGEELQSVENYINLQALIAFIPPECYINVEDDLKNISIPPLSILTFVENSLKHSSLQKKPVKIRIKAMLIESDDGKYLNFTVSDNAGGFSAHALAKLNSDTLEADRHIGIVNVKRRFNLLYREKSSFVFFNNDEGASIEVFIPL